MPKRLPAGIPNSRKIARQNVTCYTKCHQRMPNRTTGHKRFGAGAAGPFAAPSAAPSWFGPAGSSSMFAWYRKVGDWCEKGLEAVDNLK